MASKESNSFFLIYLIYVVAVVAGLPLGALSTSFPLIRPGPFYWFKRVNGDVPTPISILDQQLTSYRYSCYYCCCSCWRRQFLWKDCSTSKL